MISLIVTRLKIFKQMAIPIVIMTAMAIGFTYIFGIGFSGNYKPSVYIVNEDKTELSKKIVSELLENDKYIFIEDSYENSINNVVEIDGIGVIHFKKGFTDSIYNKNGEIYFYKQGESIEHMTINNILQGIISTAISDIEYTKGLSEYYKGHGVDIKSSEIMDTIKDYRENYKAITINSIDYSSNTSDFDTTKHYFSGFMLFFSLFVVMFGIGVIVDEKEYNVYDRIKISPLSTLKLINSNIIVNFLIGMFQLSFVIIFSKYIFDIDLGDDTLALLSVLSMYVIAGTSIGFFITGFVKNQSQLGAILPTIIVSTSMIGGCMWPLDIVNNKVLLFLANLTPQKWAMDGVKQVIIYNGSFSEIKSSVLVLLVISVFFSLASLFSLKRANK